MGGGRNSGTSEVKSSPFSRPGVKMNDMRQSSRGNMANTSMKHKGKWMDASLTSYRVILFAAPLLPS